MEIYGRIYKITNKINGKCYVGQTSQAVERRWNEHKTKTNRQYPLTRAILKYGKGNFTFEVIGQATSVEQLNEMEKSAIEQHKSLSPNGYNLRKGGDSGGHLVQEIKDKVSVSLRKHFSNPANRLAASKAQKGKKLPSLCKKVLCIETGQIFESFADASEWVGSCRGSPKIRLVTEGKKPQYKGYHWKRVADELQEISDVQV